MGKKFSIIIPVHDQFTLLDQCLQSIIKNTTQDYEIILSDSASNRKLSEYYTNLDFISKIKNLKIVEDQEKPGFSRAVNNGMQAASEDSDYYVWLNSDTIVAKNWLKGINKQDLCSPISNNATYQSTILIDQKDIKHVENFQKKNKFKPLRCTFLNGFCYIISNKVYKAVGFLDEKYFPSYASEDDYSLRAKLKGFQAQILPNNFVYHIGNQSYQEAPGSYLRKVDKTFLARYPKDWFNNLITIHTVQTRSLRHDIVDSFVKYMKGLYNNG